MLVSEKIIFIVRLERLTEDTRLGPMVEELIEVNPHREVFQTSGHGV